MNMIDFAQQIKAGRQPVVTFLPGIGDKEAYPEAGMRAKAIRASLQSDNVVVITFSYADFDDFNKAFETANYYGAGREGNKTAREAGYYKVEEQLFFDQDELAANLFTVENDATLALFAEYRAAGTVGSYTQWLEEQLKLARSK